MTFNRAIGIRRVTYRVETPYLRQILAALILLAICFFAVGVVVLVTRAQNPNCVELKKRLDDANRGYQTILAQSQSADRNFMSYQLTIRKLQSDLIANDKRMNGLKRKIIRTLLFLFVSRFLLFLPTTIVRVWKMICN